MLNGQSAIDLRNTASRLTFRRRLSPLLLVSKRFSWELQNTLPDIQFHLPHFGKLAVIGNFLWSTRIIRKVFIGLDMSRIQNIRTELSPFTLAHLDWTSFLGGFSAMLNAYLPGLLSITMDLNLPIGSNCLTIACWDRIASSVAAEIESLLRSSWQIQVFLTTQGPWPGNEEILEFASLLQREMRFSNCRAQVECKTRASE